MNKYQIFNQSDVKLHLDGGWEYLKYCKDYISNYYTKSDGTVDVFNTESLEIVRIWNDIYKLHIDLNAFIKSKELLRIHLNCEDLL